MTLRARLTLWSVLVVTVVVALISAVDLGNQIKQQFEFTLERAQLLKKVATKLVIQTLARQRNVPYSQALLDPAFSAELTDILTTSRVLLEIAVCDDKREILADSDPQRLGKTCPPYEDFGPAVKASGWLDKLRILTGGSRYFQLVEALGTRGGKPVLYVSVVVYPALIRADILPSLKEDARIALFSILGAMLVTLALSTLALRQLGRLGHMLDLLARGEYEYPDITPPQPKTDELSVMASKVSLLGQQLRGARFDFTDLRGNFERLLDELEDAVLFFGRDRRLMLASGAVEKFLGKMRADLLGMPLVEIFPPHTTLGLLLAQAVQTGRSTLNRRVPIQRAGDAEGGVTVALLSVDLMDGPGGNAAHGRGAGVLVRLRDPEATRQISRQLQTADRLSAISGITAGVAHEVKNPLNAIMMHLELARLKLAAGDPKVSPHMDVISREIQRLDRVVKTFLDFTRPVELKLTEVPLDGFVSEIVDLARPQAEAAQIRISESQQGEGAQIRVDPDLMKQAILNILVNAIEAMPGGGDLMLESGVRDDEAEIRISDTGPGIPPELHEKIFRLYFTTKKEGSGIGLAMTFRIVQLHEGGIQFSSEPGKGTKFVLRLPTAA
jgi:signal transduction histidine kinase